ncbi:hypothetical protein AN619_04970 [Thermotalea metallivorans]|uniref:Copper amine oxidase-like N-terminal domain-containing protein n=2 Tax=Thermotalea metallivorans TaxID=520762 RepID=A0A140L9Z6_9FIRM|nr:hypothetical protein AN619_04970 [Thermotalea metallivorans]
MMKRISLFFIMILIFTMTASAYAAVESPSVKVMVNDEEVIFPDTKPYINEDGRTLVPIRFVSEKLGATVDWEIKNLNVVVTIKKNDKTVILVTGEKKATVNGKVITFDTKAVNINGRTMVPLRFISEVFGATVNWNADTRVATISTSGSGSTPKNPSIGLEPGKVYPVNEVLTDISGISSNLYEIKTIKIVEGNPYQLEYVEKPPYKAIKTVNMKGGMYGVINGKVVEGLGMGTGIDYKVVSSKERAKEYDYFLIVRVTSTEAELIENTLKNTLK